MAAVMQELKRVFQNATTHYSLAPLWYWNDEMSEAELARQIRLLKEQDINEFMIFPIAGMTIPYLSDVYYERFAFCVREFQKLGMKLWVYDEYNWPSGLAGGMINDRYPEYLMKVCRFYRYEVADDGPRELHQRIPEGNVVFAEARRRSDDKVIDLRDIVGDTALNWTAPAGDWDVTLGIVQRVDTRLDTVTMAPWTSNTGGYLDVMNPEAVAKYIELVYEGHYRVAPEVYGDTIVGYFTDEPGVWYDFDVRGGRDVLHQTADGHGAGKGFYKQSTKLDRSSPLYGLHTVVPWTHDLFALFRDRYGYDLRPHMADLTSTASGSRKVANDFFELVSDRFASAYCEQIGRWCGEHKVAYSGHYGEGPHQGDYYKQIRPQQIPGIDLLGNTSCVYRRLSWPKRVASVARQHGRDRVLCETYACSPWTNQLADRIQEADLLTVLGINLHASIDFAYSYRGIRKYASNPPGFYQSPQWKFQAGYSRHTSRFCATTSMGEALVDTAVYYASHATVSNTLLDYNANQAIDRNVIDALYALQRSQIEADIFFDSSLDDLTLANGEIVGKRVKYRRLVVPDVEIMAPRTLAWLAEFVRGGGTVVFLHCLPMMGPDGGELADAWQKHFGFTPENGKITTDGQRTLGKGTIHLLSNPADAIGTSTPLHTGQTLELFDGAETMICMSRHFPHWIALDLGEDRRVTGCEVRCEAIKAEIPYRYRLEASDDGESWRTVAEQDCKGMRHKIAIPPTKTRHLRLHVDTDSERLYSIHSLDITYTGDDGQPTLWRPRHSSPTRLAEVLPEALPELVWYEGDSLATSLATHLRSGEGFQVYNLVNMSTSRKRFVGRLGRAGSLSRWNLNTGEIEPVAIDDGEIRLALDPGEAVVLMTTEAPVAEGMPVALDPEWEAVRSLGGPWPVRPKRQNAFPLAACQVWMRDANLGGDWILAPEARLPAPLRLTPNLAFRAEFDCSHVADDAELHLERWLYSDLVVNGQRLTDEPRTNHYYDCHGLSTPIGKLLKKGRNVIEGVFRPEMYERQADGQMYKTHNTQPAVDLFVLGSFAVKDNAIVAPVKTIDGTRWEDQGFAYYSGTMSYEIDLGSLEEGKRYGLEVEARRSVVEVVVDGDTVATLLAPPYRVELPAHVSGGKAKVTLKVTNSIASLFSAFHMGECFNQPIRNLASGLHKVVLLESQDVGTEASTAPREQVEVAV